MDFAVIGGDMRTVRLAELLAARGNSVICFGLEGGESRALRHAGTLAEALEGAKNVVLPLPVGAGETLNAPLSASEISVRELTERIPRDARVLAGKPEGLFAQLAGRRGLAVTDYFAREELTVKNAAATAEGAVEILMRELPVTLLGAKILVIGFGRIGKLLSLRLRALGAEVTASARKCGDMAWIEALGLRPTDTGRLSGALAGYDAVVNTVPARILDETLLSQLDEGCLCLDLASKPGGIDFTAAQRLGVRAVWALALPGRVAPESSGEAILEAIENILREESGGTETVQPYEKNDFDII